MPGDNKTTPAQAKALNELIGLVGEKPRWRPDPLLPDRRSRIRKNMACGTHGDAERIWADPLFRVNDIILDLLAKDPLFAEVFDFNAMTIVADLKRYGNRLRKAVHDLVAEQLLPEGLTILDHLELVFALGMDPMTTWYNDAVGKRRILLVLTGRMAGQLCRCGQYTLTRGDQPIVELEA